MKLPSGLQVSECMMATHVPEDGTSRDTVSAMNSE